jgi:hypothetical protein
MITSRFTIVFCYLTFLIGRRDHGIDYHQLRPVIARWFFMCAITGRYTGSAESRIEQDLRRIGTATSAEQFVAVLDGFIATQLTNDFWEVALPDLLDTTAAYSPTLFAYHAALVLLDATVLFTSTRVGDHLDPASGPNQGSASRHHLFRRKYLESVDIRETRRQNQLANYAILEWPAGRKVGAESPLDYFAKLWASYVPEDQHDRTRFLHALPEGWEQLDYDEFLDRRRKLIALVIRTTFDKLRTGTAAVPGQSGRPTWSGPTIAELIAGEESFEVEYSSNPASDTIPDRQTPVPQRQHRQDRRRAPQQRPRRHPRNRHLRRQADHRPRCRLRGQRHGHRPLPQRRHPRLDQRLRYRTRHTPHQSQGRAGQRPVGRPRRRHPVIKTRVRPNQQT